MPNQCEGKRRDVTMLLPDTSGRQQVSVTDGSIKTAPGSAQCAHQAPHGQFHFLFGHAPSHSPQRTCSRVHNEAKCSSLSLKLESKFPLWQSFRLNDSACRPGTRLPGYVRKPLIDYLEEE